MAVRPVFVPDNTTYVSAINTEFIYHSSLSDAQRRRSSLSLREAFRSTHPDAKILEVSGFSDTSLGVRLSAFHMCLTTKEGLQVPVESAYQAGKKFESGGPYTDLLDLPPRKAKKDTRLKESGKIIGFEFDGCSFPTQPATLFYTWLYLKALGESPDLANQLMEYNAFTDIVFNPLKSISCQARVCAIYLSLYDKGEFERALTDLNFLSGVLKKSA